MIFSQYGNVLDIRIKRNISLRGQAFVIYDTKDSAVNAMKEIQGFPLFSKPMEIQYAHDKSYIITEMQGGQEAREAQKRKRKEEKEILSKEAKKIKTEMGQKLGKFQEEYATLYAYYNHFKNLQTNFFNSSKFILFHFSYIEKPNQNLSQFQTNYCLQTIFFSSKTYLLRPLRLKLMMLSVNFQDSKKYGWSQEKAQLHLLNTMMKCSLPSQNSPLINTILFPATPYA